MVQLHVRRWPIVDRATVITTIEAHAAGEPLRIITGGLPELPGATILQRRQAMQTHYDHIRRALMWEPRGHFDMYGCVLTPPVTAEADFGVLFLHNEGYSTMCGHGVIALVTALIETGILPATSDATPVTLDTPAGVVRAHAHLDEQGRVARVSFLNVPSYLYERDLTIDVPGIGRIQTDIAFGGAYYAVLPAERVGIPLLPARIQQLVEAGEAIKRAINAAISIEDPVDPDLAFLYGTILTGPPEDPAHHSRNLCVFAEGEVDRSPTGTGVSARLALHFARGEIDADQWIEIESILGARSVFRGRVVEPTKVGRFPAVIPEVSGRAFITGRSEFVIDPDDALGRGFLLNQ